MFAYWFMKNLYWQVALSMEVTASNELLRYRIYGILLALENHILKKKEKYISSQIAIPTCNDPLVYQKHVLGIQKCAELPRCKRSEQNMPSCWPRQTCGLRLAAAGFLLWSKDPASQTKWNSLFLFIYFSFGYLFVLVPLVFSPLTNHNEKQ